MNCRFCCKILDANEKVFEISEELKNEFFDFTQIVLIDSPVHSSIICELCFQSLQQGVEFKNQLIKNQKFVEEIFNQFCEKNENCETELVNTISSSNYEYQCEICQKPFGTAISLKHHKRLHDSSPVLPIKCEICGKGYKGRGSLNTHMLLHQTPQFKCDLCSIGIYSKPSLKYHMLSKHLKKRSFKCNSCPKAYYKNSDLMRHVNSVHDNMTYTCFYQSCGLKFKHIQKCRSHIQLIHKITEKTAIDKLITIAFGKSNQKKNVIKTAL